MTQPKSQLTIKPKIAHIAVFVPLRKLFDYTLPENSPLPDPGTRVLVPFGNRKLIGIIVELSEQPRIPGVTLKSILEILDEQPIFSPPLCQLILWASHYYQYPLGLLFETAIPNWLKNSEHSLNFTEKKWFITERGKEALSEQALSRAPKQKALLSFLFCHHEPNVTIECLRQNGGDSRVLQQLLQKEFIQHKITKVENPTIDFSNNISQKPSYILTPEQTSAIDTVINSFHSFSSFLLYGVTGSGKTEVYLSVIEALLANKQQVLILVPEISLTPQLLTRFQQRFNVPIAMIHSKIPDKERLKTWNLAQSGQLSIIIGTRSAVFTPLKNPGLFIIDEEHDASFKQQDQFKYSARDLFIKRAQLEKCPILLGSATPSLETWNNALTQKYHLLKLTKRPNSTKLPTVSLVDTRHKKFTNGLSAPIFHAIQQQLDARQQTLLFLNRRGYAPVLMCFNCGWHQKCSRCDSHLIYHQKANRLKCHHCQCVVPYPKQCPDCAHPDLSPVGLGTEQLEQALEEKFPTAKIIRIDSDTITNAKQLESTLHEIQQGHYDIIIGTQMLSKGHHFPKLTLAIVLEIDHALFSSDFRAIERMGQLLVQVSGRAGRENLPGKVLLQTAQPSHPMLVTLISKNYDDFLQLLLEERQSIELPPFSFQALIRAESKQPALAKGFLDLLKNESYAHSKQVLALGPVAAPMEKRAGYIRAQLLLQATNRKQLQQHLAHLLNYTEQKNITKLAHKTRWSIDVDPIDMH